MCPSSVPDRTPAGPRVSIVVPVGAVDDALGEQVRALRCQQGDVEHEVVLACNSSSPTAMDDLSEIAVSAGAGWRVVDATARRGPAHARNAGARTCRGELLLFCDADDVVTPRWAESLVRALQHVDAATGPLPPFGPPAALAAKRPTSEHALPTYLGVPYLPSGNLGIRRSAFEAVGGFDERLRTSEDIALAWSLQVSGRTIDWCPDAVVHRRYRGGLWPMVRQHHRYGRGISRVLVWYGVPGPLGWTRAGTRLLRGNGMAGSVRRRPSHQDVLRRGALAAGRAVGIVEALIGHRASHGAAGRSRWS